MSARRPPVRVLAAVGAVMAIGVLSAVYVLAHQRLREPFRDVYHVKVELAAADGVAPGLGQPVLVAGVKVGSIADAQLAAGRALITLEIDRAELPAIHRDARVALEPVTPLKDMRINLDPGSEAASRLAEGATLPIARSVVPADLADLLAALDADTRDFVRALISSSDVGTRHRALGVRQALLALGPTSRQVRAITDALDRRRLRLARLVHNLGVVTRAASRDRQLASVVIAGQQVLEAVAREEEPLRQGLRKLPGTLQTVERALTATRALTDRLPSTLSALTPAVRRLPRTFEQLRPFAAETREALKADVRPLVRDAQPLVRALGPATTRLRDAAPSLHTSMQVANYALNELAFNPPGKVNGHDDEGLLFWFPWWFHNYNSMFSAQDAHGSAARAMVLTNCQQLAGAAGAGDILKLVLGTYSLCEGGEG